MQHFECYCLVFEVLPELRVQVVMFAHIGKGLLHTSVLSDIYIINVLKPRLYYRSIKLLIDQNLSEL